MLLIGEHGPEHVFIVESAHEGTLFSHDYGQFFNGKHGGRAVTRHYDLGPSDRFHVFGTMPPGRPYIGKLDPTALLDPYFPQNDLDPAEVPQTFDGGIDAPPPERPKNPLLSTRDIQRALICFGNASTARRPA